VLPQEGTLKQVRLTKLSDDKFADRHPNGIHKGYIKEGYLWQAPIVGQSCCVAGLVTSVVTEILDENTFRTENSTYRIEDI
jgi:hypothetical protein